MAAFRTNLNDRKRCVMAKKPNPQRPGTAGAGAQNTGAAGEAPKGAPAGTRAQAPAMLARPLAAPVLTAPAAGAPVQPPSAAPALKLPQLRKAAPLTDYTSDTTATIPTIAAVFSTPGLSLIAAKTGIQIGRGPRFFGGGRTAVRVVRS